MVTRSPLVHPKRCHEQPLVTRHRWRWQLPFIQKTPSKSSSPPSSVASSHTVQELKERMMKALSEDDFALVQKISAELKSISLPTSAHSLIDQAPEAAPPLTGQPSQHAQPTPSASIEVVPGESQHAQPPPSVSIEVVPELTENPPTLGQMQPLSPEFALSPLLEACHQEHLLLHMQTANGGGGEAKRFPIRIARRRGYGSVRAQDDPVGATNWAHCFPTRFRLLQSGPSFSCGTTSIDTLGGG